MFLALLGAETAITVRPQLIVHYKTKSYSSDKKTKKGDSFDRGGGLCVLLDLSSVIMTEDKKAVNENIARVQCSVLLASCGRAKRGNIGFHNLMKLRGEITMVDPSSNHVWSI